MLVDIQALLVCFTVCFLGTYFSGLKKLTSAPDFLHRQARDSLGNKRLSGGDTFLVWLEGPETVHGHIRDHENGTFTANYTAIKAGLYDLYITNGRSLA